MVTAFYSVSLLVLVLNILNAIGWTIIPKIVLLIPSAIIGAAWIWLLVVATAITIDDFKKRG